MITANIPPIQSSKSAMRTRKDAADFDECA